MRTRNCSRTVESLVEFSVCHAVGILLLAGVQRYHTGNRLVQQNCIGNIHLAVQVHIAVQGLRGHFRSGGLRGFCVAVAAADWCSGSRLFRGVRRIRSCRSSCGFSGLCGSFTGLYSSFCRLCRSFAGLCRSFRTGSGFSGLHCCGSSSGGLLFRRSACGCCRRNDNAAVIHMVTHCLIAAGIRSFIQTARIQRTVCISPYSIKIGTLFRSLCHCDKVRSCRSRRKLCADLRTVCDRSLCIYLIVAAVVVHAIS